MLFQLGLIGEFFTVRDDGITFEDTPMLIHRRRFKALLLYYKSKTCWGDGPTEDEVMLWTPKYFSQYCCTKAYHDDYAAVCTTTRLKLPQRTGSYGNLRNGSGSSRMAFPAAIYEVHPGVKQDKLFNQDKKDEEDFNAWKGNINAGAQMDSTHNVPKENYVPKDDREKAVFQKIKSLHIILEECLVTEQQELLAHPNGGYDYNVYHEMKKHALAFTKEQLSYDAMLQYINAMKIPGKWSGTLFKCGVTLVCKDQGVYVARIDWTTANTNHQISAK
jgi:hypothetical protein